MASAQQSSQESEVRNSIANAWQTNTAAMALSGFGNNSFDSISNAQVKDMNKGIGKMEANTKSQQGNLSTKMAVTFKIIGSSVVYKRLEFYTASC